MSLLNPHTLPVLTALPLLAAIALPAGAVAINDNLDIGGAVRARIDYDPDRDLEKLSFDTAFLTTSYNSDSWIGAAKYRF